MYIYFVKNAATRKCSLTYSHSDIYASGFVRPGETVVGVLRPLNTEYDDECPQDFETLEGQSSEHVVLCLLTKPSLTIGVKLLDRPVPFRTFVRSQIGRNYWTTQERIDAAIQQHKSKIGEVVAKHGLSAHYTILEARETLHDGFLALIHRNDNGWHYVVSWGESEDGAWDDIRSLERHNRDVAEANLNQAE